MTFLDRLESKLGRFAIPGLLRYIAIFTGLVFILIKMNPQYVTALTLDPVKIMAGEVWRLVSYIFIPRTTSFIFIIFAIWILIFIGDAIERAWGAFRLNLYYALGMLGVTAAAFIFSSGMANVYLFSSIFFAFATLYPNQELLLFFIIPVKVKYLGIISAVFLLIAALGGTLGDQLAFVASFGNYLLFFGPTVIRQMREKQQVVQRRAKFEEKQLPADTVLYKCYLCGATEVTHPEREFRVDAQERDVCNVCAETTAET